MGLGGGNREEPAALAGLGQQLAVVPVDEPPLGLLLLGRLAVQEVAPLAIHAVHVPEESSALLGLVLGVMIEVLPELDRPVRELALVVVGAEPRPQVVPAQLILELMVVGTGLLSRVGLRLRQSVFVVVVSLLFDDVLVVYIGVAGR